MHKIIRKMQGFLPDNPILEEFVRKKMKLEPLGHFKVLGVPGGVSSDIIRIIREDGTSVIVKRALPQLKVKDDWFASENRSFNEVKAIGMVSAQFPGYVPKLVFYDNEFPIFAMDYVEGKNWKSDLMNGNIDYTIAEKLGQFLSSLHNSSYYNNRWLGEFRDKTLFLELRISPYFEAMKPSYPLLEKDIDQVISILVNQDKVLVHGDFSPKNVIVRKDKSICVLDWEVAHAGNPAFDVAFMLSHLFLKTIHFRNDSLSYENLATKFYKSYCNHSEIVCEKDVSPDVSKITGALILARVDGKSPVEYLSDSEKEIARKCGIKLIRGSMKTIEEFNDILSGCYD